MDLDGPGGGGWKPVVPKPDPQAAKPENPLKADRVQVAYETVPILRPNPMFGAAATAVPVPTPPIPTATPTPPAALPTSPVYWGGLTEAQLAAFQQKQGDHRNDCADYSVAAVLNMFQGGAAQGSDVARAADLGFLPFGYRLWPNGPTTPEQAANIVNAIAGQGGLPVSATAVKPQTTAELATYLQQPGTAVIVTIGWSDSEIPDIARTSDTFNGAGGGATLGINAHAMVLAAYDPTHLDRSGNPAPWGFVNSWANGGTEIYWMSDAGFQQAWNHVIPLVGSHNAVVITRTTETASATPTPTVTPVPVATPGAPTSTPEPTSTPTPPLAGSGR